MSNHHDADHSDSPIDPSSAFKIGDAVLEKWGCLREQKQLILNITPEEYKAFSFGTEGSTLTNEQLERVSLILNIHAALRAKFSNRKNVYGFMSMENNNAFFDGRTPLSMITSGEIRELRQVAQYIASMLQVW